MMLEAKHGFFVFLQKRFLCSSWFPVLKYLYDMNDNSICLLVGIAKQPDSYYIGTGPSSFSLGLAALRHRVRLLLASASGFR